MTASSTASTREDRPLAALEPHEPTGRLIGAARPLTCSLAIHLGLGALFVFAGSAGLMAPQPPRAVWLDLEPAIVPEPAPPAPVAPPAASRPRTVRPPALEPRKPTAPAAPAAAIEPMAPPPEPLPPPRREAAAPEPVIQSLPSPPQTASAEPSKAPEPDRGGAASASASAPTAPGPSSASLPERGTAGLGSSSSAGPVVASRTPDASPGGPIVRAARPRGGYQVRPVYPETARRAGLQGTTLLRIHIEVDGRVSDVTVARSAGHQSLDDAAAEAVRRWRFEPALSSAGPVSMWAVVPVEFRISDRD
jgi:protein TonB